jgi:hypothetical protein
VHLGDARWLDEAHLRARRLDEARVVAHHGPGNPRGLRGEGAAEAAGDGGGEASRGSDAVRVQCTPCWEDFVVCGRVEWWWKKKPGSYGLGARSTDIRGLQDDSKDGVVPQDTVMGRL